MLVSLQVPDSGKREMFQQPGQMAVHARDVIKCPACGAPLAALRISAGGKRETGTKAFWTQIVHPTVLNSEVLGSPSTGLLYHVQD